MDIDIIEWLRMGGYAVYVWPSYVAGLLVLLFNIWLPLRRHKNRLRSGRQR